MSQPLTLQEAIKRASSAAEAEDYDKALFCLAQAFTIAARARGARKPDAQRSKDASAGPRSAEPREALRRELPVEPERGRQSQSGTVAKTTLPSS